MKNSAIKVAVVHEWFVDYSGSERVVEQILKCYPEADLFAVVDFLEDNQRGFLGGRRATTSFIQKLPSAKKRYRSYLPFMPLAIEQLDLSSYDVVISSSHAVSKGVITGPNQLHISYVHSPIRYAWDLQHQYLRESGLTSGFKSFLARFILHYIRIWDIRTSFGVDDFVANSHFISRRINKVYRRPAEVVYPPVAVNKFPLFEEKQDFYLTASRLVPYKMVPLIVEAFSKMPDKKLVVIGDGPDMSRVSAIAGSNVQVLGFLDFERLKSYMQNAKAFVFAAEEDFGITPVEAQACGTPVIAFGSGGACETVIDLRSGASEATGVLFSEQSCDSIVDAVQFFEANNQHISPINCRKNAERFSEESFRAKFSEFVNARASLFFNSSR